MKAFIYIYGYNCLKTVGLRMESGALMHPEENRILTTKCMLGIELQGYCVCQSALGRITEVSLA